MNRKKDRRFSSGSHEQWGKCHCPTSFMDLGFFFLWIWREYNCWNYNFKKFKIYMLCKIKCWNIYGILKLFFYKQKLKLFWGMDICIGLKEYSGIKEKEYKRCVNKKINNKDRQFYVDIYFIHIYIDIHFIHIYIERREVHWHMGKEKRVKNKRFYCVG